WSSDVCSSDLRAGSKASAPSIPSPPANSLHPPPVPASRSSTRPSSDIPMASRYPIGRPVSTFACSGFCQTMPLLDLDQLLRIPLGPRLYFQDIDARRNIPQSVDQK